MKLRILRRSNNVAVSGVIEALLLVGLVAIIIGIIQLQYIPEIMKEREKEHMDEVSNQFSYLKAMIDIQALTGSRLEDVNATLAYVPIMTQITLGNRALPYFVSMPSFGELRITNDEAMIFFNDKSITFSSIVYRANNMYFVQQTHILEGGGIILSQPWGDAVMRADPSISVGGSSGNNVEIHFYLPNIIGAPAKNHTAGFGSCFVRTNYSSKNTTYSDNPIIINENNTLSIQSRYLTAWNESLNRNLERYATIEIKYADIQGELREVVQLTPKNQDIKLFLTIVDIYCQIGPGWVI